MYQPFRIQLLSLIVLCLSIISCQFDQRSIEFSEHSAFESKESPLFAAEEEALKAVVNPLLIAAGNYDLEALDTLVSDKAMIAISGLKDGVWTNTELTFDEYAENVKNREPKPYCEIPKTYDFIVTEGRLALVRADAVLHRFGVPKNHEINHFTLMKEGELWKFLNIAFTAEPVAEEEKLFDLDIFARSYAQAWGSKRPAFVAAYFAENGSLQVNDGEPAIGRDAISGIAQGFMTDLPDMIVLCDSLVETSNGTAFHWTLLATNTGPGGTGNSVAVSGHELWQLDEQGLILTSQGHFPSEEYARQIEFGIEQ